jgi:hypothetical protein
LTPTFPVPLTGVARVLDVIAAVNGGYTGMFAETRRLDVHPVSDSELEYVVTNEQVSPPVVERYRVTVESLTEPAPPSA